jgi:hypothetical protein
VRKGVKIFLEKSKFSKNYLRIWSKIRAILGWSKFVSAYVERDKKILKKWIFASR